MVLSTDRPEVRRATQRLLATFMTFEDWMILRGLSLSSVKKYDGAIKGPMSEWAIEGDLIEGPLTSIHVHGQFEAVASALRELPIYRERNSRGNNMYSSALNKYSEYLAERFESDVEADIDSILSEDCFSKTEKRNLIKSRIGQGVFRQRLVSLWGGCSVTGYKDPVMLVASHIKPWRIATNSERLDRYNGLLLLPTLDRAFDSGLISFGEKGEIMISPQLERPGLLPVSPRMGVQLRPMHSAYMQFHREQVFRHT